MIVLSGDSRQKQGNIQDEQDFIGAAGKQD
jgi:hypothetical protein